MHILEVLYCVRKVRTNVRTKEQVAAMAFTEGTRGETRTAKPPQHRRSLFGATTFLTQYKLRQV